MNMNDCYESDDEVYSVQNVQGHGNAAWCTLVGDS